MFYNEQFLKYEKILSQASKLSKKSGDGLTTDTFGNVIAKMQRNPDGV